VTAIGFNICCSVPNFIKIWRFFTEIWRFNDFQNGGRPPSWILNICSFCHVPLSACRSAFSYKISLKSDNRLMIKKRFSRWRPPPSWILKISILVTWLSSGSMSAVVYQISSKSDYFFTDLAVFKMAGRPPSWICYDVTVLHCGTHFRWPNIVLKFHVDRFCSFRDTCNAFLMCSSTQKLQFWIHLYRSKRKFVQF